MNDVDTHIGEKYGRLTIIAPTERLSKKRSRYYRCQCECGRVVDVDIRSLKTGNTKSCGCLRKLCNIKHGDSQGGKYLRLYRIWCGMKERCDTPGDTVFKYYGGRGIHYCDEWKEYINFKQWAISNGYDDKLTLDRIDADGDYYPSNCRWIPYAEQNLNKRNSALITYNGETHCVSEWARIIGMNVGTLRSRISKKHWTPERALTEGVHNNRGGH